MVKTIFLYGHETAVKNFANFITTYMGDSHTLYILLINYDGGNFTTLHRKEIFMKEKRFEIRIDEKEKNYLKNKIGIRGRSLNTHSRDKGSFN